MRANICTNMKRLVRNDKNIPIFSLQPFHAYSQIRNLSADDKDLVCLSYPSDQNEFSIFPISEFYQEKVPKLHFFSSRTETKNSIPNSVPKLVDVTNQEVYIDYDSQTHGKFELLNYLEMKKTGNFSLGEAFNINSVDSIVKLFNDPFHEKKLEIKHGWISGFGELMETISRVSDSKNSTNVIATLPNKPGLGPGLENIVLSGGSDKNLRFMNFGAGASPSSLSQEAGNLDFYHLSNIDNQPRSYSYCYNGEVCMVREELSVNRSVPQNMLSLSGREKGKKYRSLNGFSKYHEKFFGGKKSMDTLPGHSAAINDILIVEGETDQREMLVLTTGDDHTIKVWC